MFKNLTFFRFPRALGIELATGPFDQQLAEHALKPVGPQELAAYGWVSPTGLAAENEVQRFTFWGSDTVWLTLGGEHRLLPAGVIYAELHKRLKAIEEREGRAPGGRARKRIKEDLIFELLPKAFVEPSRLDGYLDLVRGLLVVNTASRKQAENFAAHLRLTLGSFPALPLNAEAEPRLTLSTWVGSLFPASLGLGSDLPEGLAIGDEAILKDPADKGAIVRVSHQYMGSDEVIEHFRAGKRTTRVALTLAERVGFTLDEDLTLRKFKLLDIALEGLEAVDCEDREAELAARFALLTGEVARVFDVLAPALRFSTAEA